jgi:hypothetical protein
MGWVLFLNRSLCKGRTWKISEFRVMIVTSLRCDDVKVVTPGSRHLAGLLERRLWGLPAVYDLPVLAHRFDGKAHFFFFFFFFFRASAWLLNACANERI